MAIRKRTPEELKRQARHVLYEIQMLAALTDCIRTGEVDDAVADLAFDGVPARNAIVEAFELHARNLIEFLIHPRTGRRSTARDYAPAWRIPDDAETLRTMREEFSERVGHLSWKRSSLEKDGQVVASAEIFDAIDRHLQTFFDQAEPDLLSQGFTDKARWILNEARPSVKARVIEQKSTAITTASPTPMRHTGGTATPVSPRRRPPP